MPAPGDQHRPTIATHNPFEETKPHISEYSAQEIATLQSRLEKQLGPEYISSRPGAGNQKVHYLAAEKAIQLANEVFGFNGWSSTIKEVQIDFVDENQATGKICLGLSVIVRVTLRDGSHHEDIGYGHIENCKGKAAAFEKAKKEGTTDALKRALRNFGNILGNCIYDKDYLAKVTKLKPTASKWDPDGLHRHQDYASIKREPVTTSESSRHPGSESTSTVRSSDDDEFLEGEFNEADYHFNESEHPDEMVLDVKSIPHQRAQAPNQPDNMGRPAAIIGPTRPPPQRLQATPVPVNGSNALPNPRSAQNMQPIRAQSHASLPPSAPQRPLQPQNPTNAAPQPQLPINRPQPISRQPPVNGALHATIGQHGTSPQISRPLQGNVFLNREANHALHNHAASRPGETAPQVGFVTAKAAESVQAIPEGATIPNVPAFNPHLDSPSIRKTAGVDHRSSKPVKRENLGQQTAPNVGGGQQIGPTGGAVQSPLGIRNINFVNPQADQHRRIGMPPGVANSPLQSRSSYKPPQQLKRPADAQLLQGNSGRPPLSDVTNTSVNAPSEALGGDIKRIKTTEVQGAQGVQGGMIIAGDNKGGGGA
ncbi:DNA repair protein rad52 [Agyrium rufum]|nr:DNA repair protein rad52 [Agyrium rufum]